MGEQLVGYSEEGIEIEGWGDIGEVIQKLQKIIIKTIKRSNS